MTSSYFSLVPNLQYNLKPIEYPFSSNDYVIAKNFFKKIIINKAFDNSILYEKVILNENFRRIEQLAELYYGRADYDWIIILTNKIINPLFDIPLSPTQLRIHVEANYDDPYGVVRHYEIISNSEQEELYGRVLYDEGTRVDKTFYESSHQYLDGSTIKLASGRDLSSPVTIFEYENDENEKKRELYLLKARYVQDFIDSIRKQSKYKQSSSFLSNKLKKTNQ